MTSRSAAGCEAPAAAGGATGLVGEALRRRTAVAGAPPAAYRPPLAEPDFGPDVRVVGPGTPARQVRAALEEGGGGRVVLFGPGRYAMDVRLGPHTSVVGLGAHPEDVTIDGAVRVAGAPDRWEGAGSGSPTGPLHRVRVRGRVLPAAAEDAAEEDAAEEDAAAEDGTAGSGPDGRRLPVGVEGWEQEPAGGPRRGRPFLYAAEGGHYRVFLPGLRQAAAGADRAAGGAPGCSVPLDRFYVARPADSARALNRALSQGRHLLLTPGGYDLADTVRVKWAGTVVLGLGPVVLRPRPGVASMTVADARGVRIAGLVFDTFDAFDAVPDGPPAALEVGARRGGRSDPRDPASVQDVYFRTAGAYGAGGALVVRSEGVLLDRVGVWRTGSGRAGGAHGGAVSGAVPGGGGGRRLVTAGGPAAR
ncbi:hypothetical protein [Actinacidiphila sp. bgisy145]|uniref:hypothetical protein n=1 Tax=Actinacidiphila sp. bgisy145 TaxID=3413792 RepID=UPI003EBB1542